MASSMFLGIFFAGAFLAFAQAEKCYVDTDVGILLDSSVSMKGNYKRVKNFINALARSFQIGGEHSRLSVITFSRRSELSIKFNDFDNLKGFQNAVNKIPFMGAGTYMDRALRMAQRKMFTLENGAREYYGKLLILLTDGKQDKKLKHEDPAKVIEELRWENGIEVMVIGIGDKIDKKEVSRIAGGQEYAFKGSFKSLSQQKWLKNAQDGACMIASQSMEMPNPWIPMETPEELPEENPEEPPPEEPEPEPEPESEPTPPPTPASNPSKETCPEENVDYFGNDVKLDLNVPSWKACGAACKANEACKYFTFVADSGCCYQKSAKGEKKEAPGLTSGSQDCTA